jgi:RimJ/RimL family protein N-acetyltransferase
MAKPLLQTARLELWRPRRGDAAGLAALIDDEDTRRFLGPAEATMTAQFQKLLKNAGCWALYGYGSFHVRLRGENEIIASCGVFHSWRGFGQGMDDVPEAGWIVRRDHWGQGVANEAMDAALDWFDGEHGLCRIAAMIEEGNAASQRLAIRLGFKAYGHHIYEGSQLTLLERGPK